MNSGLIVEQTHLVLAIGKLLLQKNEKKILQSQANKSYSDYSRLGKSQAAAPKMYSKT